MDRGGPVEWRVRSLEELRRPGDGLGAFDSDTGESVVQWCLGGRRVGQKSPIEVHHAQKSTELTGGLGRGAVLEVGHSFFQRLGTFGRHLVTKDGDLRCSESALRRVDDDPVSVELLEESPQVLFVLFE
jgi:hypothetical protein